MKPEREQIREMADALSYQCMQSKTCDGCFERGRVCSDYKISEKLYKAGYRKADEVIDEFVGKLKKIMEYKDFELDDGSKIYDISVSDFWEDIERIVAEMRQEVEK